MTAVNAGLVGVVICCGAGVVIQVVAWFSPKPLQGYLWVAAICLLMPAAIGSVALHFH